MPRPKGRGNDACSKLAENLETFLDRCRSDEHELPQYVEKELREYLSCGILGNG
jgi:hypothetical protein